MSCLGSRSRERLASMSFVIMVFLLGLFSDEILTCSSSMGI